MVHQHFMLIPVMSVAENIVLGLGTEREGHLSRLRSRPSTRRELAGRSASPIDPDALVRDITVGQQQRVEILKALYRGAEILILDEPTAVLTPQEASELFGDPPCADARGDVGHLHHATSFNEVLDIADR